MGLQVVRPISLVDGILDITNAEDSRVEFTGRLSNGLTYATLTYITDQNQNGARDSFKVDIDTDDLDSSGNFIHIVDLAWNSSNDYVLARIETNLGSWSINSSETDTASFKIATQIDPSDSALAGFQLINNRQDRTHPIAAISAEGIEDKFLDIDAGEEQLRIHGFLAEYRDDGKAGSGDPELQLIWRQSQGAHETTSSGASSQSQQFLRIHYPSLYSSPDWESTEWGGGANAFGHVDVDHNIWNYFYLVLYIQWTKRSEHTGAESYVLKCYENKAIHDPSTHNASYWS